MYQSIVNPDAWRAGPVLQDFARESRDDEKPDAFERIPFNLSSDEIRAIVLDVLG